ncbi:MAG: DUF2336 domain-containing protein [Methylocystis sp.]|nr:DUF2336 domain-containing protein [Methylocystis sp.]
MVDASLLRVAVEQFVERATHPIADVKQFEQLALGLIDRLDAETVAHICRPLCGHAETPPKVYECLREKGGPCAELAFEYAPAAGGADMRANAARGPIALAVALARRKDLDGETVAALVSRGATPILRALARNKDVRLDESTRRALVLAARDDLTLARILLDRADLDIDREPLFLAATRLERMAIVLDACRRTLASGSADLPRRADNNFVARLEQAALRREREEMANMLAEALDCRRDRLRAILADSLGDGLALALAALGVDRSVAVRIFLCADALISHDPDRVRALIALMRSTPRRAAMRVVKSIAGASRPERDVPQSAREEEAGWRRVAARATEPQQALEQAG